MQEDYKLLPFRPCAGIMLFNTKGKVFVGSRLDMKSGFWQMPQGGIDEGEDPLEAAFRELKEEIGTNNARLIRESKDWIEYDLPDHLMGKMWGGKYRGQRQKWFAMEFLGEESEININTDHPEFKEWQWLNVDQLVGICVAFKKHVYQKIIDEFSDIKL